MPCNCFFPKKLCLKTSLSDPFFLLLHKISLSFLRQNILSKNLELPLNNLLNNTISKYLYQLRRHFKRAQNRGIPAHTHLFARTHSQK